MQYNTRITARLLRNCSAFLLQIRCRFAVRETKESRVSATDGAASLQIRCRCSEKPRPAGISGLRRTSAGRLEPAFPLAAAAALEEDCRGDRGRRVDERDSRQQRGQQLRTAIEA